MQFPTSRPPRASGSSSPRAHFRCYGAGMNFHWQLSGDEDAPRRSEVPIRLEWLEALRPSALACGGHYTYCVSEKESGAVYRWGTDNGRVYRRPEHVEMPAVVADIGAPGSLRRRRAVAVACGAKHTLILLEGGVVLGCGTGYFGQLGCGDDVSSHLPRVIERLAPEKLGSVGASGGGSEGDMGDRVVSVAAGGYHSGCFTRKGDVYMWGFNRSGQCGVGAKGANTVSVPVLVDGMKELRGAGRAVQLVCGRHHSSLLTETGAVFSWGATSFGRLGIHDLSAKKTSQPKRVTTLDHFAVHAIAAGDFHMLALTRDRRVFSWGYGAEGQCGHGGALHLRTPRPIEALRHVLVSKIACGAWYSAAVSADGYLYTWGYGDGGWLGHERVDKSLSPSPPPSQQPLAQATPPSTLVVPAGGTAATTEVAAAGPVSPPSQVVPVIGGDVCSFDSGHNVYVPGLVNAIQETQVTHAACGGTHLVVLALARPNQRDQLAALAETETALAQVQAATKAIQVQAAMTAPDAHKLPVPQRLQQQQQQPLRGGGGQPAPPPQLTQQQQQQQQHACQRHPQEEEYRQGGGEEEWSEQWDGEGNRYWYNSWTGESAWAKPGDTTNSAEGAGAEGGWHGGNFALSGPSTTPAAAAATAAAAAAAAAAVGQGQHAGAGVSSSGADRLVVGGSFGRVPAAAGAQRPAPAATPAAADTGGGGNAAGSGEGKGGGGGGGGGGGSEADADDDDEDLLATLDPKDARRRVVFSACRHGRLEQVQEALNTGFPIDDADEHGNTLLFVAAQNGLKAAAKLCLRNHTNLNRKNTRGNTPLHYCFKYGHSGLGAYLIKKGADDTVLNHAGLTVYEGI